MNANISWAKSVSGCGVSPFASWLKGKRHNEKQAQKPELNEWENEGGNLARSPEATDTLVASVAA